MNWETMSPEEFAACVGPDDLRLLREIAQKDPVEACAEAAAAWGKKGLEWLRRPEAKQAA